MCGICGVFRHDGAPVDTEAVRRMTRSMSHRGPDGEAVFVAGQVGLGHRRLSIIDIEGGNQPVGNEDGKVQVVFNGEIYNFVELRQELKTHGHIFRTRSDTEVIVHAYEQWGFDCVTHFNGIFGFALWDDNLQRLFLARDHLGVKPLYYVAAEKSVLFASEIKALLQHPECPRSVDIRSLSELFTLRYVPSPATLFSGIRKLPPGHAMSIRAGHISIWRYWHQTPQMRSNVNEEALTEEYRYLVEDAVRLQMRSDVPVGLFLSSGIDSGALLSIMRRHTSAPVHTFTIGFLDGQNSNETDDARRTAQRLGADHEEMMIGPDDYMRYYERYLWDLEEPVGNETAAAFYFVSHLANKKVKVALTGQGADEPWGGYHRHIGVKLSQAYSHLPQWLTETVMRPALEPLISNQRIKRGLASLYEQDVLKRMIRIYSFYTPEMKQQLFRPWLVEQVGSDGDAAREHLSRLHKDVATHDSLTQMLYIDTRANLPDDLLMVSDKTSMANSLESRVPFLDYRVVEFVETLPPHLKLRGFKGKYLHKKAAEAWLPKSSVYVKKKGFANPIDKWMRAAMSKYLNECLLSDRSAVSQYFDLNYIRALMAAHEAGKQNYSRHLYLLVSFELWHRQFIST